jgi:acetoin utilization deacetylase AcuC-like enzyme
VKVFYSDAYVAAAHAFDTTRKASWIAASLRTDPIAGVELLEPTWAKASELQLVHAADYVEAVRTGEPRSLAESNGLRWDHGLWDAVRASTGGAVASALAAFGKREHAGSLSSGLHHAHREHGAGFCTFNGLALAARTVVDAGARRVIIVDLDAHMGGGTFSIVAAWPEVWHLDLAVCSYVDAYQPRRHSRATLDIVSEPAAYLPTLRRRLAELERMEFDLLLYNAGVDPHEDSNIGGLSGITTEVLRARDRDVFAWANWKQVGVAVVLAGGYAGGRMSRPMLSGLHRETIGAAAAAGDARG